MNSEIDFTQYIPVAASIFGVSFILNILYKSAQNKPSKDGNNVVAYSLAFKILSWLLMLAVICGLGLLIYGAVVHSLETGLVKACLLMLLLFSLIVIPLLLEATKVKVTWDHEFLYTFSPWRKNRVIPIYKVRKCTFSRTSQYYTIETEGHGSIRIHTFKSGIAELLQTLRIPTPPYPPLR